MGYTNAWSYLWIKQETKSWYANYKIQNRIFQSSATFIHDKKQNVNLVHLYLSLVESFALIFDSKIVFKKLFWLKLSILKKDSTCT